MYPAHFYRHYNLTIICLPVNATSFHCELLKIQSSIRELKSNFSRLHFDFRVVVHYPRTSVDEIGRGETLRKMTYPKLKMSVHNSGINATPSSTLVAKRRQGQAYLRSICIEVGIHKSSRRGRMRPAGRSLPTPALDYDVTSPEYKKKCSRSIEGLRIAQATVISVSS
ncbi:Hypothetical predicted protein [Octopus vulgaris]|uniref:Uncharacterized protein n=1 Tax=Octopus vulgaris TaxID=6645 RepID=A0AA36B7Y8_OCTVU|nr:Hypothetical predicted protein [Octopus vulgaris]